jgi:soluble lytic murein transglycosylase-like protein
MTTAKCACLLIALATQMATAQISRARQDSRVLSACWAEYYAAAYRVPVDLVMAIIDEESAWNPYAISNRGAVGLMQLMPETALRFGVRNRFRPDENIRGGVAYLARLNREFDGDLRLVTAAYYVGEAPIRLRGLNYSSAEVQGYVRCVAERYRQRRQATVRMSGQQSLARKEAKYEMQ